MKKFKMPSAMVIVFIVLCFVAVLTWFVPTSVVVKGDDGVDVVHYNMTVDEDGNLVEAGTKPAGLWQIIMAPIQGFQSGASVIFAIIITGSFLAVLNAVGALDAGIGKLLNKYTGPTLICILMLVFALMGTIYGTWEELPAYAIVIIPLFVAAGYDVMTGIAVLFVGACAGNMASVVNPFSTGAAVAAIGNDALSLGSGIGMRMVMFVVLYLFATWSVLRYAKKVKADKNASVLVGLTDIKTLSEGKDTKQMPELTKRRKWSLVVFVIMILSTVVGYIPWGSINVGSTTMYEIINYPQEFLMGLPFIGKFLGAGAFTNWGDWYFDEFSWVFLIGCVVVALINKMSEKDLVKHIVSGARDLLGVGMVLAIAKGISILMGTRTEGMSVTFVYWIQNVLKGVPAWGFVVAAVLAYVFIGFFMQSTSGVSGITMPILGAVALALFATSPIGEIGGQIMLVSAMTLGLNLMTGLYPGATTMGTLELVNVPYDRYLKFMLKQLIPLILIGVIIVSIAPYLGLI